MSLFSAFGKASLNFVTKLGEIVAPIDDEDEVKDTNRKVENDDNQLTEDGNLITESGDRKSNDSTSIMQQFTSISSVNLSGAFNNLVADKTPANQSGVTKSSPVAALPANVETKPSSSSCMVEIEVDESFESTPLKAPPSQQNILGALPMQSTQNQSQSNDADESGELFLGSQPENKQTLFLPPSQKYSTSLSSSTHVNQGNHSSLAVSSSQKDSDIAGSTARAGVESLKSDSRAVDVPGAAASKMGSTAPFESIVNSFPVYNPPSDAAPTISHSDDGVVSITTGQKHPHPHPHPHSNNNHNQHGHHDLQVFSVQQGSSSSSSSSHTDSRGLQESSNQNNSSSHQNNNNNSSSSSSSSSSSNNGDNKNLFPTTAAGFFDVNHNKREVDKEKEKQREDGGHGGKSLESLSFVDHPPGEGNHALNEQLG